MSPPVFIAGATGYMGQRLAETLLRRGHSVLGLVRSGSERRLYAGCKPVFGNALDRSTFVDKLEGAETYVQLVGVAHPSPTKGEQFRQIDLKSCEESVAVAVANRVRHFIYVSVAHPAPMMTSYIEVRTSCEQMIQSGGLNATILRPWYVLGPGHYWPYLLTPAYWLARQIPSTRPAALRLGLVKLPQMIAALAFSVDSPATGIRIVE
ncbi:MAG TPA: NAD(P)H-binding protein, partial [Terriglobales bacterium]|nr:NAD(P)H-binding protein [Terriglobales bacterium]